jgi:RHS repeat-associated protein
LSAIALFALALPSLPAHAQEQIDPRSGQLLLTVTDLTLQVEPVTLELRRTLLARSLPKGLFGGRWQSNWESRVVSTPTAVVIDQVPYPIAFTREGRSTEYRSASGERLVSQSDGRFVRTMLNGTTETYDAQGRLIERDYRNGNKVIVRYGADGRIARIDGPRASFIEFTADALGRVTRVATSSSAAVRYGYAGDNLSEVQVNGGPILRYAYDARGALTRIEHPRLGTVEMAYDARGRVLSRRFSDGSQERYEYDDAAHRLRQVDSAGAVTSLQWSQDQRTAEITDPLGHKSVIVSDPTGRPLAITGPTGAMAQITYDALGRTVTIQNPLGQVTRFVYVGDTSRINTITRPDGTQEVFEYDPQGNLIAMKLGSQVLAVFTYLPDGSVATAKGVGMPERRYTYDSAGRRQAVANALGERTQYEYDARGNLLRETNPLGGVTRYQYDSQQRLVSVTDPVGGTTRYDYDPQGRLRRIIDPIGSVSRYDYDARGRLVANTNPTGEVTRYEYDAAGRIARIVAPGNRSGSLRYDAAGNLVGFTDALGRVTRLEHDALGRLTHRWSDTGLETTYQYDPLGRLLTWGNSLGAGARLTYDALGRLTTGVSLDGAKIQYAYDAVSSPSEVIQPGGSRHRLTYNPLAQLVAATEPSGDSGRYEYDAAGRLIAIHHPAGGVTRLSYDGLGNLLTLTDALGRQLRHAYDQGGRRLRTTDPLGRTVRFAYDARGQLVEKRFASGKSVRFEYGPMGELRRADDGAFPMRYAYDAQGRLTAVEYLAIGKSVRFTYNALGLREKVIDAHGQEVLYRYDGLARLSEIVLPGGSTIVLSYDPADRLTSIRYPNGVEARWSLDAAGQATAMTYQDRAGKILAGWKIRYDGLGNPVQVDRTTSTPSRYEYDPDGRLITERRATQATVYSYSSGGNRASQSQAGTTRIFRYDLADELLEAGAERFTYDAAGNLVGRSQPRGNTSYEFDEEGRLGGVVSADGGTATFGYAPTGERVSRRDGTGLTHFLYDGWNLLQELPADGSASPLYIHGPGIDRPLAMLRDGQQYFFLVDPLGSVIAISDGQGQIVTTYEYDAFGALMGQTGSVHSPFRFTAREYESGLGLYYYRHRYYDPALGRFLTRDPRAARLQEPATLNGYAYVRNNPLKYTDPLGLEGDRLFWHYTSDEFAKIYQNSSGAIPASKPGQILSVDTAGLPSNTARNVFLTDIPPPAQFNQGMQQPWDAYPEHLPDNLVDVGAASYQRAIPIYESQIKAQGLPIYQDPRNPNIFKVPADQLSLNVEPGSPIPASAGPEPPAPSGPEPAPSGAAAGRITAGRVIGGTLTVVAAVASVTHIVTSDNPAQAAKEEGAAWEGALMGAAIGGEFLGPPGALIGGFIGGLAGACIAGPCPGGGPIPYLPPESQQAANPASTTSVPASPVGAGTPTITYVPLPPETGPPPPTLVGPPGLHPIPMDRPPSPLPPQGVRSVDPSAPPGGQTLPPYDPTRDPGMGGSVPGAVARAGQTGGEFGGGMPIPGGQTGGKSGLGGPTAIPQPQPEGTGTGTASGAGGSSPGPGAPPLGPQPGSAPPVPLPGGGVTRPPVWPLPQPGQPTPGNQPPRGRGTPGNMNPPATANTPPTKGGKTPVAPGNTQTPTASGGQCRDPICYYSGQEQCEKGPLPNEPGWLPACYANMLARCNAGEAGGTGPTCVHKGADPSCAVRAQRVCGGR